MKLNKYVVKITDFVYKDISVIVVGNKYQMLYLFNFNGNWYSEGLKLSRLVDIEEAKERFENEDIGFTTPKEQVKKTIDHLKVK